jgi:transcriptional regulator with XRE-family HTH domain
LGPKAIETRREFAQALTSLRARSGLTVRELARRLDAPVATVGDYFSGRHLPGPAQVSMFKALLLEVGVEERDIGAWVDALTRVRQASDGRVARGPAPYRELQPFEVDAAGLFFGRQAATDELLERLRRALASGPPWPVLVVGSSASDKPSLLPGGLAARLAGGAFDDGGGPFEVTVVTPAATSVAAMTRAAALSSPRKASRRSRDRA